MRQCKSDQDRILDEYLETWGAHRREPIPALGYASESIEARMQADGRMRSVRSGARGEKIDGLYIPVQQQKCTETRSVRPRVPVYDGVNDMARIIESAFNVMRNEQWRAILIARYVRERKIDEIAEESGISGRTVSGALRDVRSFLWGWIIRDVDNAHSMWHR